MSTIEIAIVVSIGVYTIISAFLSINPRIPVIVGLGLLSGTAIILTAGNSMLAEKIATVAFFSLASGQILLFILHVRGHQND